MYTLLWQIDAHTERGAHRARNQDCIHVDGCQAPADAERWTRQTTVGAHLLTVAVADGIDEHRNGHLAASLACAYADVHAAGLLHPSRVVQTVHACHEFLALHDRDARGEDREHAMGTTLAAIVAEDGALRWVNVGDSRIYRFDEDTLVQLSTDDHLPARPNVLTQCLGAGLAAPDTVHHDPEWPRAGTTYLLCSDGLSETLDDETIAEVLRRNAATPGAELVALARESARDNVTVAVLRALHPDAKDWRHARARDEALETTLLVQRVEPALDRHALCIRMRDHDGCPYVYRSEGSCDPHRNLVTNRDVLARARVDHVDDEGVHLRDFEVIGEEPGASSR